MRCSWFILLCAIGIVVCIEHDFKGFDDSILFGINWPGPQEVLDNIVDGDVSQNQDINNNQNKEILKVTTANKEKYECKIPELKAKESTSIEEYDGPSPINLLKPLFSQKICSYRLESYWSYEVCHGRYIRQYHEEREGKQVKTQEYYLGHWGIDKQMKLENEMKAAKEAKALPKTTKVEGTALPYVEMVMEDGTICDLSGKPRMTRVLYVCYSHGKHEVYSFKETSTCEYEIIILSPLLCEHPQFKPKEVSENIIECLPVGDAPKKPRSLLKMEVESLRFHHQSIRLMSNSDLDGETHLKFELHPLDEESELTDDASKPKALDKPHPQVITDDSPVRAFLNGDNCLNGGTGWWKYEFCYGKHVVQYHVDRTGEKTTLLLGKFDEAAHLEWIKENKGKAPKPVEHRTSISHFYAGGDVCDKTGKPRQTEVKLKCLENSSSPAQVSLYLLEPRTCHYILGVESPLICDILPLADEQGLIKQTKPLLVRQDAVVEKQEDETAPKEVPKFGND
ncbi:endoplasmic reticulum lectin 1 isoform X2 [Pectinophora gossypiella]|uniref:endoplasmic reticulum lectin 1 isoform X2 n=1 Tax=Pectinophora gossypiella TaxID=13191 RepID=UPI00214F527C|nr:endoplasmic reticulum lectin 1 isoform X2 [Pectinophora gossypiella]